MNVILPHYAKIKNYILENIKNLNWKPGFQIPSENELSRTFSVSRMTVNKALKELTNEGVLFRLQGKGTFVADNSSVSEMLEIKDISEEIESIGKRHSFEILEIKTIKPDKQIQKMMSINENDDVYYSLFLHFADNEPFQIEERYVNKDLVPDFIKISFQDETAHKYLMRNISLTEAEHIVEAIIPEKKIIKLLKINDKSPCLSLKRRTWLNNKVVTYARFISAGDKYKIGTRFKYSKDGRALRKSINR